MENKTFKTITYKVIIEEQELEILCKDLYINTPFNEKQTITFNEYILDHEAVVDVPTDDMENKEDYIQEDFDFMMGEKYLKEVIKEHLEKEYPAIGRVFVTSKYVDYKLVEVE